jgi:hypothetical protein
MVQDSRLDINARWEYIVVGETERLIFGQMLGGF